MNTIFHRRVQVIISDGPSNPQIKGYEEFYENGRHQVRSWGEQDLKSFSEDLDNAVFPVYEATNLSALSQVRAIAQHSYQKIKRVIQNIPNALKAAIEELNR